MVWSLRVEKNMSINIALCQLHDRVAPRFDQCAEIILISMGDDGTVTDKKVLPITPLKLMEVGRLLTRLKTRALICGGIKQDCQEAFRRANIEVIDNVIGNVEPVVMRYMRGQLNRGDIIPDMALNRGEGTREGGNSSSTGPTKGLGGAKKEEASTDHIRYA